jgi:ATP-dependent RNA helicase RhlE
MRNPREVQVTSRNTVSTLVSHLAHPVDSVRKRDLLIEILSKRWQDQVLVFGKTKHGCNRLAEQLEKSGISTVAIHGNRSQSQRLRALADFKSGDARVLVATDVAARGIDIPQLPLVINFDLPMVAEDYVHRIGRTGRAGATGEAISLACVDEEIFLRDIQRLIHKDIPREVIKGFEPDPNERAEPIVLGRMTIGVGGNRRSGNGGGRSRPAHPSRAGNALQGTHAPRDARAPQGQRPSQGPRPGARSGGGSRGGSGGTGPQRGGRGR